MNVDKIFKDIADGKLRVKQRSKDVSTAHESYRVVFEGPEPDVEVELRITRKR